MARKYPLSASDNPAKLKRISGNQGNSLNENETWFSSSRIFFRVRSVRSSKRGAQHRNRPRVSFTNAPVIPALRSVNLR